MMSEDRSLYLNETQRTAYLMDVPESIYICGRGMGKSTLILAPKVIKAAFEMPRCVIANVASSYQQHLTRTVPALMSGFEMLGYIEGRDYFARKYAPESWGWEKPRKRPILTGYTFHFRSGSVMQLISQDVIGSANGMDIDYLVADEAKMLKQVPYEEEILPAMRGNRDYYKASVRNSYMNLHHNVCLTTDMPTDHGGMWLLDKQKKHDVNRTSAILHLSKKIERIKSTIDKNSPFYKARRDEFLKHRRTLYNLCKAHGKDIPPALYYHEADSFENIHVLGKDYFYEQLARMDKAGFESSILNRRRNEVPNTFYPDISKRKHGYTKFNNSYLYNQEFNTNQEQDCRQDGDLDPVSPLHVSGDYGGSFNGFTVAQLGVNTVNFINAIHVLAPLKVYELCMKFKEYYRHHKNKHVILYTDHTHIGTNAVASDNIQQAIVKYLTNSTYSKWRVTIKFIGQTPGYDTRHYLWSDILKGKHKSGYLFHYNEHNCKDWQDSCTLAPMSTNAKGAIIKDKTSERPNSRTGHYKVSQEKATHFSDAGDILLYGILNLGLKSNTYSYIPT